MGGDHLQELTQTNFGRFGSLSGLRFSSYTTSNRVFIDPPSCWRDCILASDQLRFLEQLCACGATSISSSPSSHVTMDKGCSPSYLNNNDSVKLHESMLLASNMSAHFAKNDQPYSRAQFDHQFVDPNDSSPSSISESGANNHQSSLRKSASRQMILKKPTKTTAAKRKISAVKKCEHGDKKKSRNETISSLSLSNDNKVGKETMGDRIARLQRLVSPLGKSDTASVLSECIEYIRFLHEQVTVLSTAYTATNVADTQLFQDIDGYFYDQCVLGSDPDPASLRSRGLCIVPVSGALRHTHDITWAIGKQDLESKNLQI